MGIISPNRKGKPSEKMGRKALDLNLRRIYRGYGSWVAEVGVICLLVFLFTSIPVTNILFSKVL